MPLHPSLVDKEFWYDDIILLPNNVIGFERSEVDLSSWFTKRIKLKTPFVSSPMDTVTGADMAIAMALQGGIGVIHYNFGTLEEQIREIEKVKRYEAAFVMNPVCLPIDATVEDVYALHKKHGFYTAPITDKEGILLGLVKHRDVRYIEGEDRKKPVREVMTPKEKLIVANRRDTLDRRDVRAANRIIREHNLETLPIVDDKYRIVALVTDRDLKKDEDFPLATKNGNKQLKVFAAAESRLGLAKPRIDALAEVGCDGIVIDAGSVFADQFDIGRYCKENTKMEVIPGSIATATLLEKVVMKGSMFFDAYRIGVGPGMSCTTQEELGHGRAQGSAVYDCAQKAKELEDKYGTVPIIADGRVKKAGDVVKAIALGADTVMMGGLLSGFEESPGETELTEHGLVKKFRGMGSMEAMRGRSADRYGYREGEDIKIPEGKTMEVPYKGQVNTFLPMLRTAVQQSMLKLGFKSIEEMQQKADIRQRYLT